MLQMAKDYGFRLSACRPYRAQTKGKVERFNHYLKNSFIVPLAATLKAEGLLLDVELANAKVGAWLHDVAHQRIHGITKAKPADLLIEERQALRTLPAITHIPQVEAEPIALQLVPPSRHCASLQHPVAMYEALFAAGGQHAIT